MEEENRQLQSLTLAQVAYVLAKPEDDVFELIKNGKLFPAALFSNDAPVPVKTTRYTGERITDSPDPDYGSNSRTETVIEKLTGCFGVSGPRGGILQWETHKTDNGIEERAYIGFLHDEDNTGRAVISVFSADKKGESSGKTLWSIERKQLRVSVSSLEFCLSQCLDDDEARIEAARQRLNKELPPELSQSPDSPVLPPVDDLNTDQNESPPFHNPTKVGSWLVDYAKSQLEKGKKLTEVAGDLRNMFLANGRHDEPRKQTPKKWRDEYCLQNWILAMLFHTNIEHADELHKHDIKKRERYLKGWGSDFCKRDQPCHIKA